MRTKTIRNAITSLLQWLEDHEYSSNTVAFYRNRCTDILVYSEQNGKKFELNNYLKWAENHTAGKTNTIKCGLRKSLVMIDCIINDKPITTKRISSIQPLKLSNRKYLKAILCFLEYLRKRGLEENTICSSVYCAKHFFKHMEKCGGKSVAEITGNDVSGYFLYGMDGLANSSKRTMAYRLKQLFECLYTERLLNKNLSVFVPTNFVIRKKVVTVLPEDVVKSLTEWNGPPSSIRQARDYAIYMLAVRLMLRKSDILKLKLSDIDWNRRRITIVQKKNKRPLILPLTDDVGNALAVYILDFRPESGYEEVFLTIHPPKRPIKVYHECLSTILPQCGYTQIRHWNMHMLRRTGASNLLRSGTPVDLISTMLGHQNVSTVDPYLSLDEERMLLCCGNFSPIGLPEVLK